MKKLLMVSLTLAVCAALFLTMEKEPEYILTEIAVRDITEKIEAVGTVNYAQVYAVTPRVAGTVARIFVSEGDRVKEGQALAELELLPENAGQLLSTLQNTELTQAQLQEETLKLCTVKAAADGTLFSLPIYKGMQVAPAAPMGSIVSRQMAVTALIPESAKEDVKVGQKARVTRGSKSYAASIVKIEPSQEVSAQYVVTLQSGALTVLSAGMKVDVEIVLTECSAPAVPLQAIGPDGTITCKLEDGTAAVAVKTGLCDETYAQLVEGPPVGTQVVLGEA